MIIYWQLLFGKVSKGSGEFLLQHFHVKITRQHVNWHVSCIAKAKSSAGNPLQPFREQFEMMTTEILSVVSCLFLRVPLEPLKKDFVYS